MSFGDFLFCDGCFAVVVTIVDVADTAAAVSAPFSKNDMICVVASSPKRSGWSLESAISWRRKWIYYLRNSSKCSKKSNLYIRLVKCWMNHFEIEGEPWGNLTFLNKSYPPFTINKQDPPPNQHTVWDNKSREIVSFCFTSHRSFSFWYFVQNSF